MSSPIYVQAILNSRLTDVANAIDGGGSNGTCRLYDTSNNLLSSLSIARPCGTASGGVLTFIGMPWVDPSASATGSPVSAQIFDSTGTLQISGLTVGTGSTSYDIVMSSSIISAGQSVAITSATITGR